MGRPWLPVSRDGGRGPTWRNDGREIVFVGADFMLHSVAVAPAGATLRVGQPDALFRLPVGSGDFWTATPDLKRFVAVEEPGAVGQTLHVMTNWQAHIAR